MWTAAHDHVPSGKGESMMGIFALFGRKKESGEKTDDKVVYSPVKGEVIRLEDVEDETFASGAMGPGRGWSARRRPARCVPYFPQDMR